MVDTSELMKPMWVTTVTRDGVEQKFLMDRIKAMNLKVDGATVELLDDNLQGGVVPIMFADGDGKELVSDKGNQGQSLLHLISGRKNMLAYLSNDYFDLRQSNLTTQKQKNTYKKWQLPTTS